MKFFTLVKHELRILNENPAGIFMFLAFPMIMTMLMGFLFSNMYDGELVSSYDFYGVTMTFFMAMMGSVIAASSFLEKRVKGRKHSYLLHTSIKGNNLRFKNTNKLAIHGYFVITKHSNIKHYSELLTSED
ncbi:MAG: hypothetical protein FWC68_04610 [Oscillospiraceae bacterium]|nr:hypothetical protein [Oscillospiraceae bacterium]